jgi:TonB family protein
VTTTEDWTKWESQIVSGVFPLLRFLGKSNHSVVFLTEAQGVPNAVIKLVPADPVQSEAQLSNWRTAASLSHPHLIRLLDFGTCQLGGHPFLFVVMEYAEQTLAQILPHRALTVDEVRELLLPTLDALAFLHRNNLVHRQLKPPNLLVVGDQLKLASDTICPAGESASGIATTSPYDPPEAGNGVNCAAGDIWSLGIVIAEALTQSPSAPLAATLAPEFAGIVRQCLSHNPGDRPSISELEAHIKPQPVPDASPVSVPDQTAATRKSPERRVLLPAVALGFLVLIAVWASLHLIRSRAHSHQAAAGAAPAATSQIPNPPAAEQAAPAPPEEARSVLHQEIPDVPRSARESIHGHIKVAVRVTVDRSGTVVGEAVEDPGSSRYFARVASTAARKWKFAPADNQSPREWLLRFEFTRDGTTGRASPRS